MKIIINSIYGVFDYQETFPRKKIEISPIKHFATNGNDTIKTYIRNLNLEFLQKSEFQNPGNSTLIGLFDAISMSISQNEMM